MKDDIWALLDSLPLDPRPGWKLAVKHMVEAALPELPVEQADEILAPVVRDLARTGR